MYSAVNLTGKPLNINLIAINDW